MQIVIKLDEDVFTRLFDNGTEDYAIVSDDLFAIAKSIRKGTPLPEHHGRLIDADKLPYEDIESILGLNKGTVKSRLARARNKLKQELRRYL